MGGDPNSLCSGGDRYYYSACIEPIGGDDCVIGFGTTRPNITMNPHGGVFTGNVPFTATASSAIIVNQFRLNLSKWDPYSSTYKPVYTDPSDLNNYCSFCSSDDLNCGIIFDKTYGTDDEFRIENFNWVTNKCNNANFILGGFADDANVLKDSERYKLFYFTTSNPDAPACLDKCSIFTSKTLKTVVAKIKTWLEPYPP